MPVQAGDAGARGAVDDRPHAAHAAGERPQPEGQAVTASLALDVDQASAARAVMSALWPLQCHLAARLQDPA